MKLSRRVLCRYALSFALLACFAPGARATTYFVRPGGDDHAEGTSAATAFKTLVRASAGFNHGDSIVIGPGHYRTSVVIAERFGTVAGRMNIVGDESGKLTGDAPGAVELEPCVKSEPALQMYRLRHVTIEGLTFVGSGQGLKVQACDDAIVRRCTFRGFSKAFWAEGGRDLRLESSVFASNSIAIDVQNCVASRLAHNTVVASTSAGIIVLASAQGSIVNTLFAANNTNYVVDNGSAPTWTSDCNAITGATGPWGAMSAVNNIYELNSATDQERHSIYLVPAFADPGRLDLHIDAKIGWGGGLPGACVGQQLTPPVEFDRDGNPFRRRGGSVGVGAYDYPDPIAANGWNKLAVSITSNQPRQSAGIYRGNELVRTLLVDACGARDLWWDGRDDQGRPVPPGPLVVRGFAHDVRLVDDGAIGDNGNPLGAYNPDNSDRIVALADGGFVATEPYDEAGYCLRRFSSNGQPTYAGALDENNYWALAAYGDDMIGALGQGNDIRLVRLVLPGTRATMATGANSYPILDDADRNVTPKGVTVVGDTAYVSLAGIDAVRAIDLKTGRRGGQWTLPDAGDIAHDANGAVWALSGRDLVRFDTAGQIAERIPTGLDNPVYLAAGPDRELAVDRANNRIALFDGDGHSKRVLGLDRNKTPYYAPVQGDTLRDPRGAAFLEDGRIALCEAARIRVYQPDLQGGFNDFVSNFVDTAVVHPTQPEYVYAAVGIYKVDPRTGSWQWVAETPPSNITDKTLQDQRVTAGAGGIVLGGRPFVAFQQSTEMRIFDVTDPLKPRLALTQKNAPYTYDTWSFSKNGDIVYCGTHKLNFTEFKYQGLDAANNPIYDFAHPQNIGVDKDPDELRGMSEKGGLSCDRVSGAIYHLAVTKDHSKMVPGWGADGSGVGKALPDGTPQWFALSSGGNYMSISTVHDDTQAWIMACKSFGGQIDVFDPSGLRVTTGNWSYPCDYRIGFIDVRYGLHGYLRPDGNVGGYVEDDAIGRLARFRMEGRNTLVRFGGRFVWNGVATQGEEPVADRVAAPAIAKMGTIPRVAGLKLDTDWSQWKNQGIAPQIVAIPANVAYKRVIADDLMTTFREGTLVGALAHDDRNLYAYFAISDSTMHFDAKNPGDMWKYDGIEFWLEEEQFGLGFLSDGTPQLYKYRFHNRQGEQWKGSYPMPNEDIVGMKVGDLASNPLGRMMAEITGVSFQNKPGYVLMAKIPYEEVKLVGGIAGRGGTQILPMTGDPGEVLRVAVSLDNISAWGQYMDYQIVWPVGSLFSDPTRSFPFELGK